MRNCDFEDDLCSWSPDSELNRFLKEFFFEEDNKFYENYDNYTSSNDFIDIDYFQHGGICVEPCQGFGRGRTIWADDRP